MLLQRDKEAASGEAVAPRASWDEKLQVGLFRACCGRAEPPVCLLLSDLEAWVAAGFLGGGYTHARCMSSAVLRESCGLCEPLLSRVLSSVASTWLHLQSALRWEEEDMLTISH